MDARSAGVGGVSTSQTVGTTGGAFISIEVLIVIAGDTHAIAGEVCVSRASAETTCKDLEVVVASRAC